MSESARRTTIVGDMQPYPPEIDVPVSRRARAGGIQTGEDHLVGGQPNSCE